MEMLFTGRWLDAEEAHRWGMINRLHPADQLMEEAWTLVRLLESGPPLVFAAIKEVAREAEAMRFKDALDNITGWVLPTVDRLYGSEDLLEGFKAFAERRDPVWKGKYPAVQPAAMN